MESNPYYGSEEDDKEKFMFKKDKEKLGIMNQGMTQTVFGAFFTTIFTYLIFIIAFVIIIILSNHTKT